MATSETTNLQLVKYGAGTDNFIRTDYNGNLDKIDEFAGDTSQAIAEVSARVNIKSETLTLNTKIASYNTRALIKSADVFSVGLDITVGATAIPAWEAIATASTLVPSSTRQAICTVNNVTGASMVACGYLQFSSAGNISLPVTLAANTRYNIRAVGI